MNRYIKDSSLTFISQVSSVGFATISGIIVARVLGPQGKGAISLLTLLPFLLALFGNLGVETANAYLIGKRKQVLNEVITNSVLLSVGIGISVITVFLLIQNWLLQSFIKGINPHYFRLSILTVPFLLSVRYHLSILQGSNIFKYFNYINILKFSAILVLISLFLGVFGWGLYGGVLSYALGAVLTSGVGFYFMIRIGWNKFSPSLVLLNESFLYGIKAHVGTILQFLNYRLDIFIINYLLNIDQVGYYSIGVSMAEVIWHIPLACSTTLFPRIASSDEKSIGDFTARVCRNMLFITFVVSLVLALVARPLIYYVYGPAFSAAVVPLLILLFGVVAMSIVKVLNSDLAARGKPQYVTYIALSALIFTITLDFCLIPRLGIVGAAFATAVAYSVAGVAAVLLFQKETKKPLSELLIIKKEDLYSLKFHTFVTVSNIYRRFRYDK